MRKVSPGDQLSIPADTYNKFIDAAQAHQRNQLNARTPNTAATRPTTILIKNTTSSDVPRFGILTISEPIITPTDNELEFKARVAVKGVMPTAGDDNFVITTEPIAAGAIGSAIAIGVTPVTVEVTDDTADYLFAAPATATADKLTLTEEGTARVLWREDGLGDKLALVRLAGGGAAAGSTLLWAKAKQNWVNVTANGSYVYCNPCSDINATTVNTETDITVYLPRCAGSDPNVVAGQVIAYQAAADGSYVAVSGYLDAAIGTIRMWSPNSGDPPAGWEECSMLSGRFPRGRKLSDERYDTTGTNGGSDDGTHAHRMQMDMSYPDLTHSVEIDFGIHGTHIMTMLSEDASPPWCIVRFIERVG